MRKLTEYSPKYPGRTLMLVLTVLSGCTSRVDEATNQRQIDATRVGGLPATINRDTTAFRELYPKLRVLERPAVSPTDCRACHPGTPSQRVQATHAKVLSVCGTPGNVERVGHDRFPDARRVTSIHHSDGFEVHCKDGRFFPFSARASDGSIMDLPDQLTDEHLAVFNAFLNGAS